VQQISREYFNNNNTKHESAGLTVEVVIYTRSGKYVQVQFAVFPANYGFVNPVNNVDSPWHLSKYINDPEKVRFIEKLRVWAEAYSDIIFNNFQSGKQTTTIIPEFVYVSANNSRVISAAVSDAEVRVKIETEAKAKIEAELRAKIEAESKSRAAAELSAKIEAEAKAKIEAESKAKIEAELRAKIEAESRAKIEVESRAKIEAELRAKIEAELRARVVTTPPASVPATPTSPARVAAIGNVDVTVKTVVGQAVPNQPTQVTTNPIDQVKKTSSNEVWISFNPSISVQERQFCRIVENFRIENALAVQSKNQIKVNETFRNLSQSLNSLLPDGKFQGWVMRTVAVDQAPDGSAAALLELPCNIYVGSNACDANPQNYYGTAPEGSRMYTELAKMTVGDFALTSGQFVYTDDKAFDKTRSVASFRYMRTAAHCKAKEVAADTEFFGIKLDMVSTIK
jgi:hypothetical protein